MYWIIYLHVSDEIASDLVLLHSDWPVDGEDDVSKDDDVNKDKEEEKERDHNKYKLTWVRAED